MIYENRIRNNGSAENGKTGRPDSDNGQGPYYVLYWMQASVRTVDNPALHIAMQIANQKKLPLICVFGVVDDFPGGVLRSYTFLMEGLAEVSNELKNMNISFFVFRMYPPRMVELLGTNAAAVITDYGYLPIQKKWRTEAAAKLGDIPFLQVEGNVVVPVEKASPKEEYSAATLRRKITLLMPFYLETHPLPCVKHSWGQEPPPAFRGVYGAHENTIDRELETALIFSGAFEKNEAVDFCRKLGLRTIQPVPGWIGGCLEAEKKMAYFAQHHLEHYHIGRNDPSKNIQSNLSPYLHFGMISPVTIINYMAEALGQNQNAKNPNPGYEAFVEELLVRRELAVNYVHYNHFFNTLHGLPPWVQKTLRAHEHDPREYRAEVEQLEGAETPDPAWNAAQQEMMQTGKMHGYMRMYWGKKILEWVTPLEKAFQTALYLNDTYELDGRDPNGYAGVAWCFGKHDRPWRERPIFGMVRYMNAQGLKRKFNIDEYIKRWNQTAG